jgi:hypothetical protein
MSCSCRWFSFRLGAACGRNVWRDMPALTNEVGDHPVLFPELHVFRSNTYCFDAAKPRPPTDPCAHAIPALPAGYFSL